METDPIACGGATNGVSGKVVTAVPAVTSCHSNRASTAVPGSTSRTVAAFAAVTVGALTTGQALGGGDVGGSKGDIP